MNLLTLLLLSTIISPIDTAITMNEIEIVAPLKQNSNLRTQPISFTSVSIHRIESNQITAAKELSLVTPNFYIPDYGSRMTSSVYVRGLGARIDQPVIGMNVDNVPYLNKNNYDFDFYDIQRIDILRGPQSTLYGRNTIGGTINIYTLSPFAYTGSRFSAEYSSGNTYRTHGSFYNRPSDKFGFSFAAAYGRSDGFFTNQYDGSDCDWSEEYGFRSRQIWNISEHWNLDNSISFNRVDQGGFAYAYCDSSNNLQPVNHNDPCGYERTSISDGLSIRFKGDGFLFSSVTSYQFTDDEMNMDNDFLPDNIFTLTQKQKEHDVSQDFVIKTQTDKKWQRLWGAFGFYKHNKMDAPVLFKRDGIENLILANANKGIHTAFPTANLKIEEDQFNIQCNFKLPTYGAALYHQSDFTLGKWNLSAGIRFDYEHAAMDYDCISTLHYLFDLTMSNYKGLTTSMSGDESMSFTEILPRVSVQYTLPKGQNLYASVAKGYKAGGYNTQIFSDILQTRMMNDLMSDLGVYMSDIGTTTYNTATATSYDPEYSWNYELGGHFTLFDNSLFADVTFFYIDCKDQQLTVFPTGKSTGRMMSNAGKSESFGTEVSLSYKYNDFNINTSYGYTNAKFRDFNDGNNDYTGNYVPYAPQNTVSVTGSYLIHVNHKLIDRMRITADWKGVGRIYWNESNSLSQDFYGQTGASIAVSKKNWTVSFWGKNITDEDYYTFYFASMSNNFLQSGKPQRFGIALRAEF